MVPFLALTLVAQNQTPPDPYQLNIGAPGQVAANLGYTSTSSGKPANPDEIAAACDDVRFLLVGESHATPTHHQAQADLVQALVKRGRHVVVGMEMFTRDNQMKVYGLSSGRQTIEEFETASDWKTQWGHPFAAYRPLLEVIRENRLRIVALNVPRDWVRQASRQGFDSFDAMQRKWVPSLDLTNENHKQVFNALMGGHPPDMGGINIYAGQVTWDTGMAKSAIDWSNDWTSDKWIMVIAAGSGHVMYGQAINYRLQQLAGMKSKSVVCISAEPGHMVSRGIADYVFMGEPGPDK
ncbi:MAG: ChaN family lipoprotein [Fimbriimonadaceae bacterium]|nr:ChaN family lipoprotein [Fimbriimonadaceae bacterium]